MKQLTFIRHAKSDWSLPELMDFDRPLNKRGKKDAPEMGRRLLSDGDRPQLILLSAAARTIETVELLKETAGWQDVETQEKEWLYLASMEEYIRTIEKFHDEIDHVCFCGHNPTITGIINYLTGVYIGNVPTCGVAIINFKIDSWKHIIEGSGRLKHYDYPKNL